MTHSSPVNDSLSYWQERQAAALPVVELPTDFPRTARVATLSGIAQRRWPQPDALAQEAGTDVDDLLLAGFCVLVGRLCGEEGIAMGVTGEAPGLLPLAVSLEGTDSFRTLVDRVRNDPVSYTHLTLPTKA